MARKIPEPLDVYRHFKGGLYIVKCIAKHCANGRELVIYQALYEPFEIHARPLADFMEDVDKHKHPFANQDYVFERVEDSEE